MEKITINQLRVELKQLALSNKFIKDFWWGDLNTVRGYKERVTKYPLLNAYTTGATVVSGFNQVQMTIEICDQMTPDWKDSINDIESDTFQNIQWIFNVMTQSKRWNRFGKIVGSSANASKFVSETQDRVAGWRITFTFQLFKQKGICDLPFDGYDFNPNVLVCAPVIVQNSDYSYLLTVPSGSVLDLPNITVTDSDGTTRTQPSVTDVFCKLAEDATLTLNNTPFLTIPSGATENIQLVKEDLTPFSDYTVVGNVVTVDNVNLNVNGLLFAPAISGTYDLSVKNTLGINVGSKVGSDFVIPNTIVKNTDNSNSLSVVSGVPMDIPNETITLNGGVFITKPSWKNQDIELVTSQPFTVVGNKITVDACPLPRMRPYTIRVNSGTNSEYTIATNNIYSYSYDIDTSDGQYFIGQTGNKTITFPSPETDYLIEIRGYFPQHDNRTLTLFERDKLKQILQGGDVIFGVDQFYSYGEISSLKGLFPLDWKINNTVQGRFMFFQCLMTGEISAEVTLDNLVNGSYMFYDSRMTGKVNFNLQNCVSIEEMFYQASFEEINIQNMENVGSFGGATFSSSALKKLTCQNNKNSIVIAYTSLTGIDIDNLANSVADRTGFTSPTVTMTIAQKASCNNALWTAKNWTIATV